MVVNEKGLMRAMKAAYGKEGYKVANKDDSGREEIVIGAPGWAVIIEKKNMPRKILGLIAEHLGKIPEPGEAFQVAKHATQTEIFHLAMQVVEAMDCANREIRKVKPTPLHMHGYRLWQRQGDLLVFQIRPTLENIMLDHGRVVYMFDDDHVLLDGNVSRVFVNCFTPMRKEESLMQHLSQVAWVSFEK